MRTLIILAISAIVAVASCSSSTDGPTPVITSVMPTAVCTAQHVTTITITGTGFSPIVKDALTSTPSVLMPTVAFVDASGAQTEVPADGVSVPDTTGTVLVVQIPQALVPPGVYSVAVENPDGHSGVLANGLTIDPPPDLVSIDPTSGAIGATVAVTLHGTGFLPSMTVTLGANPPVTGAGVTVAADGTSATLTFDLTGIAAGTYDVVVDNGDGCTDTLAAAFTVYSGHDFTLTGIDPPFGCTCSDTSVTIGSAGGFVSTPRVELRPHGLGTPVIALTRVAFVDVDTVTAVVPMGLALGDYDLTVLNPPSDGGTGRLDNAFRVVAMPIPTIEAIVPSRGSSQTNTPVSIFGENFRDPVRVELLDRTLAVVATVGPVTPISANQIDATLPTAGMTDDAYLVRVTDLDEMTYSTFSSFIVGSTGASGNLHTFAETSTLVEGRRMLAGVSARDDLGSTFVYAIGGDTGATGNVLDTVEVSQLSKFGALGTWHSIRTPNHLTTTRDAPIAVAVPLFDPAGSPFVPVKTYIYVSGGRDAGGAVLGSVERAMVLRNADAPKVTSIGGAAAAGTLAAGTWYYKVSAVLDANDPDNPGGETLASDEAITTIGGATTAIDLAWSAVTVGGVAAMSYRVYRTAAADGASQQEVLVATVTGTTYTDTGAAAGSEPPLPPGSLGVWRVQTPTHGVRWGHQGTVVTDGTGARFLYVLGGKSNATTGYLDTVEVAAIDAQGHLGAFGTTNTVAMATPRAFFSLAVETLANVAGFTGIARFFILGGVDAGGASQAIEVSDAADGGANGAWSPYAGAGVLQTRAGPMAVITGDKLFALGGAAMATATTFTNPRASGGDIPFNTDGTIGTPIQSTASAFPNPRALGVAIIGAGFIYFVGGTSTGTDVVATSFQTF